MDYRVYIVYKQPPFDFFLIYFQQWGMFSLVRQIVM